MDDAERLREELRATREELVRTRSDGPDGPGAPLVPDREEAFLRLGLLSVEQLEAHVERLERDLADLECGIDRHEE